MKTNLVAYFSVSGKTEKVAKTLAEAIRADLFQIKPEVPYTTEDLNWMDKNARSNIEMKDDTSRPAIAEKLENMGQYDTVFLGFPIWWYIAPMIINTFLESYDFSGKTVILFATSGGSGFGGTLARLRGSVDRSTVMREGNIFNTRISKKELADWVESLKL